MPRSSKPSASADANPPVLDDNPPPAVQGVAATASAVLLKDLDLPSGAKIRRGAVVQGQATRIERLADGVAARPATAADLAVCGVNVRPLD